MTGPKAIKTNGIGSKGNTEHLNLTRPLSTPSIAIKPRPRNL